MTKKLTSSNNERQQLGSIYEKIASKNKTLAAIRAQ
jgi:hypothetical protein